MIYAFDINKLDVVCKNAKRIILTDSVKYHTAKFKFSEDWEHFSKTAYFINKSNDKDEKDISVPMFLGENETVCLIPWEVLAREGQLVVSIQGVQDDTEIWTKMNRPIVLEKSDKDSDTMPQEPTIPIYNQLLNKLDSKGDSIQFEDDTLSLKSGDKVLSTAKIKDETKDYESLLNIPTLNNIEIKGNKTANDYNIGNGLKVDEAKVTYKGKEISFKDFIAQYLKDNESVAKLIGNKAKKFNVNSPLSKEIGEDENADILKLKDKSIDKQFLTQSVVDVLENIENIDFADYSQYSTEDNFYDLSQLDENKTIFVNKAGYVGIANSILYDWQAEEPTQKQNNVIYVNVNSFIIVNKGENGYKSIYFITDENQYYFEKLTIDDDWKLYRTNLNATYQAWQFAEQLDKTKQDNLISGENIKTINNESILGAGNIEVLNTVDYTQLQNLPFIPITDESIELTQLADGYYITIHNLCKVNVNNIQRSVFDRGTIFSLHSGILYYCDSEGPNYVEEITRASLWHHSHMVTEANMIKGLNDKQNKLISGRNIKTINNEPILGEGNLELSIFTDFNDLVNLPITPVLTDSIELTTLKDSFYIVNIESCNILVSKETKATFTQGVIACKWGTSFSYWDNESMHYISNFNNDAEWIENYTPTRTEINEELEKKQDKLVSGTSIKTINHKSILGRGNIDLSTSWTVLKNESISEDTEHYTLSNLEIGEYYIWLSKETPINTGVQDSLTVDLFGTNITLGNLETDSKNVLLHIIKQSNDYALLDWSTITPNTAFALSSDRNFGLFPTPVTNNSVTIRTSMGNLSSGTQIKVWNKG